MADPTAVRRLNRSQDTGRLLRFPGIRRPVREDMLDMYRRSEWLLPRLSSSASTIRLYATGWLPPPRP